MVIDVKQVGAWLGIGLICIRIVKGVRDELARGKKKEYSNEQMEISRRMADQDREFKEEQMKISRRMADQDREFKERQLAIGREQTMLNAKYRKDAAKYYKNASAREEILIRNRVHPLQEGT